ncbi:hypothetical protein ABIB45_001749 [Arthrobacter sp. UYCo732]
MLLRIPPDYPADTCSCPERPEQHDFSIRAPLNHGRLSHVTTKRSAGCCFLPYMDRPALHRIVSTTWSSVAATDAEPRVQQLGKGLSRELTTTGAPWVACAQPVCPQSGSSSCQLGDICSSLKECIHQCRIRQLTLSKVCYPREVKLHGRALAGVTVNEAAPNRTPWASWILRPPAWPAASPRRRACPQPALPRGLDQSRKVVRVVLCHPGPIARHHYESA